MEDTHCVVPRLDVPLPADCSCSAADSQLPAPLVRASSELSPTSSLLNFQDSPAPRPDDAPPTVSSPVTPASSPGHDPPPALMGIRSRSGSEGDLLEEPSPSPRMLVGAAALPKHTQPSAPEPEPCGEAAAAPGQLFFAAVYDGHGGRECAEYLRERLHRNLEREIAFGADPRLPDDHPARTRHIHDALLSAYLMTDMHVRKAGITSGSTAVTAILNSDHAGQRWCHIAGVGDAAAIIGRQSSSSSTTAAIRLSATHRPCVASERQRVQEAGGFILRQRVLGVLAVTRAMGNHGLKQDGRTGITARPDCESLCLSDDDRFLVLASDGLTDVLSDQFIVECVSAGVHKMRAASVKRCRPVKHAATTLSKLLIHKALQRGANDNVTAMVIIL